nr:hypothetical protein [Rubripirellula sp.]
MLRASSVHLLGSVGTPRIEGAHDMGGNDMGGNDMGGNDMGGHDMGGHDMGGQVANLRVPKSR